MGRSKCIALLLSKRMQNHDTGGNTERNSYNSCGYMFHFLSLHRLTVDRGAPTSRATSVTVRPSSTTHPVIRRGFLGFEALRCILLPIAMQRSTSGRASLCEPLL